LTGEKLSMPAEIWCRTCGYFRPIANQNKGKAEEFRERVNLKVPAPDAHPKPYSISTRTFAGL